MNDPKHVIFFDPQLVVNEYIIIRFMWLNPILSLNATRIITQTLTLAIIALDLGLLRNTDHTQLIETVGTTDFYIGSPPRCEVVHGVYARIR